MHLLYLTQCLRHSNYSKTVIIVEVVLFIIILEVQPVDSGIRKYSISIFSV